MSSFILLSTLKHIKGLKRVQNLGLVYSKPGFFRYNLMWLNKSKPFTVVHSMDNNHSTDSYHFQNKIDDQFRNDFNLGSVHVLDNLIKQSEALNANAILGLNIQNPKTTIEGSEVIVYGTAVRYDDELLDEWLFLGKRKN